MRVDRPTLESEEIEITPEMIGAGVSALPMFAPSEIAPWTEERLVSEVYRAMRSREPRP